LTASEAEYLQEQLEEFERRTAEAENLYKRMAADFDNYRRRVDREREEFANLGAQRVLETMLPALDDMDRAVQNLSEEMELDKLLEGIRIVTSRIMSCLEQAGIKPLKAVGEQFDPYFHEPVQQVKTSKHPDGSVVDELRKGYTLNNKVVRPALVTVASNPGETEAGGSPAQETEVLGPAAAGAAGKGSEASGKKSKGVSGQVESSPDASSEAGEDGC